MNIVDNDREDLQVKRARMIECFQGMQVKIAESRRLLDHPKDLLAWARKQQEMVIEDYSLLYDEYLEIIGQIDEQLSESSE